jgi:hypothetical protein
MDELEYLQSCCSKCGETEGVEKRWSFGYYAGRLCRECCFSYRDHCGLDQEMGHPSDLDESSWINADRAVDL